MISRQNFPAARWRLSSAQGLVAGLGTLVFLLGAVVIAGWHFQLPAITKIRPEFVAMQYLTAVGFILSGAGLLAIALRRGRVARILGGSVGLLGLILCLEYVTGRDWGIDWLLPLIPSFPGEVAQRPSPPTSLSFMLCGAGILLRGFGNRNRWMRLGVWVTASFALAFSAVAIFGYVSGLSGTYVWGAFIGMAVHTAVGVLALSGGLIASLARRRKSLADDPWIAVPVFVTGATCVVVLFQALLSKDTNARALQSQVVAENLAIALSSTLNGPLRALERMKERWEARGGTPYDEWRNDAQSYLEDEKVFKAIEWIDSSMRIRWVEPGSQSFLIGLNATEDQRWDARTALREARDMRTVAVSPTLLLKQEGRGFLVYFSLYKNEKFDGFLTAAFQIQDVLDVLLFEPQLERFDVTIFDGPTKISGPDPNPDSLAAESIGSFHGHQWRFVVSPATLGISDPALALPYVTGVLGLLLSAALAIGAHGIRKTRHANRLLKREIARRNVTESKLRESEERQRLILEAATGVSVVSTDVGGTIRYFSSAAEDILGYSAEEMVGRCTPALFHDAAEVARRGEELTRQLGKPISGFEALVTIPAKDGRERREWTYLRKDGARRSVDLTVTPLRNHLTGEIAGYLGTALDITQRKELLRQYREAAEEARNAEALLEAAGSTARLGHWELRLGQEEPIWSAVTYAIHEVPVGKRVTLEEATNFFHSEDRETVERCIKYALKNDDEFDFEVRLITAKGRTIWVHSRGYPVHDELGKIVGLRGVFQDVDERHRAAELLQKQNRQLDVARNEAESHARAKAEFLANMSHEIRTPLNAVIGMSELLLDAELPEHERGLVKTINSSGDILLGLINDILDFSKIESGQMQLEEIPIDIRDGVETALEVLAGPAAAKDLELMYWIDPEVPPGILGDITRLRQVIVNLVANAIKFTMQGEVLVNLSRRQGQDGRALLLVEVRDSGIGIAPEKISSLFQAFSQVDASTTRRFGGTGLGLAISKKLVEMMGGRIWVESNLDKGSNFQFEIPLRPVEIPPPAALGKSSVRSLAGLRVLIVDDNETNRWILQMQTKGWGMESVLANGAREAMERLSEERFDLAILDFQMPDVDGLTLAAQIREKRAADELPIMILTSVGDVVGKMKSIGVSAILTKPVKAVPLFSALCQILIGSQRQSGSTPSTEQKLAVDYPLRVLVAEDNEVNQRVVRLMLQRLGYQAAIVSNGLEVLEAVEAEPYDVILLDVQMPEMDGLETAREICKRFPAENRPWMVALTAHALETDRDGCMAAGMDDYLSKPIRRDGLSKALITAHAAKSL